MRCFETLGISELATEEEINSAFQEKNKTLLGQRTKTQGRSWGWGGKEEKFSLKFAALLPVLFNFPPIPWDTHM